MRFDRSDLERLQSIDTRKANRTTSVRSLPSSAEPGDTVLLDGELHVFLDNKWHDVAQGARDAIDTQLAAIVDRVTALEADDG